MLGFPVSKVAGTDLGEVVLLDVDATVVITHSEKELASATFKRTFGYHPIGVWCDNTNDFLAAILRTGKAGSNTVADHIEVLTAAIAGEHPADHAGRFRDRVLRVQAQPLLEEIMQASGFRPFVAPGPDRRSTPGSDHRKTGRIV